MDYYDNGSTEKRHNETQGALGTHRENNYSYLITEIKPLRGAFFVVPGGFCESVSFLLVFTRFFLLIRQ